MVKEITSSQSSGNFYNLWDIKVPTGFVVSITLHQYEIISNGDIYTSLFFGDNTSSFSKETDSCFSWTLLTDNHGLLHPEYKKFGSRSSTVTLIFSRADPVHSLGFALRAIKRQQGKRICHFQNSRDCRFPLSLLFYVSMVYVQQCCLKY